MLTFKLPVGGNTITISTSVISLMDAIAAAAGVPYNFPFSSNSVMISAIDETVRLQYDGNDPSGTQGIQLFGSTLYSFKHIDLGKVKLIRDSGATADATLNVTIAESQDYEA